MSGKELVIVGDKERCGACRALVDMLDENKGKLKEAGISVRVISPKSSEASKYRKKYVDDLPFMPISVLKGDGKEKSVIGYNPNVSGRYLKWAVGEKQRKKATPKRKTSRKKKSKGFLAGVFG